MHISDTCMESECNDRSCIKRHQRKCKYFVTFGSCKFASNCAYLHPNRAQEEGEIASLKDEIRKLKIEISKMKEIINERACKFNSNDAEACLNAIVTSSSVMPNVDSLSDVPQIDGNYDSYNDGWTINDDVDVTECISSSIPSSATVLSPPALPPDDGTCVSCDAEYLGWDDFIDKMKKSNYMCFGCFDFFPDQPWFKRSL